MNIRKEDATPSRFGLFTCSRRRTQQLHDAAVCRQATVLALQEGRLWNNNVGKGVAGMLQHVEIVQQNIGIADDDAHFLLVVSSSG